MFHVKMKQNKLVSSHTALYCKVPFICVHQFRAFMYHTLVSVSDDRQNNLNRPSLYSLYVLPSSFSLLSTMLKIPLLFKYINLPKTCLPSGVLFWRSFRCPKHVLISEKENSISIILLVCFSISEESNISWNRHSGLVRCYVCSKMSQFGLHLDFFRDFNSSVLRSLIKK